jgi:putative IMPACT (imprinted ancient) family translation regulator
MIARMSHVMRCVTAESRHELDKIKGSRFIATVCPSHAPAEAATRLDGLRREFPGATHHCWAYRFGRLGDVCRAHDDGEPSGTAGRPILQQLEVRGLTDTFVVVTRFFGGTKLGAGGWCVRMPAPPAKRSTAP